MTTTQRRRVELDWAGPHTTLTGTLNAATGLLAAAQLGHLVHLSPMLAMPTLAVGALATQIISVKSGMTGATQVYRFLIWAGGAVWLWWVLSTTPYQIAAYAWLVTLGVAAGVLAPGFARIERNEQIEKTRRLQILNRQRVAIEWESRLAKVCKVAGCRVANIELWEPRDDPPGATLDVDLPGGGHKWRDFVPFQDALAADAELPNGCGVEIHQGHNRRAMLMKISFKDVFNQHRYLPADHSPETILNPVWYAWQRTGEPVEHDLRSNAWCVMGQRNSGKTTHEHVVIRGVVRCVDAVLWVMDLNAGGLGIPWAKAWYQGRAERPAVDWIAGNEREAEIMTEAALAVALDRKVTGQVVKMENDVMLLPVSPELPAIIIIGDEMAEILAMNSPHRKIRTNLAQVIRIARDSAVNVVLSVLRGTADVIDFDIKKQCGVWTVMRVQDDAEIANSIGWTSGLNVEDLPYKGCGATIGEPGAKAVPWRGPDVRPSDIDACAVAVSAIRPDLDADAAAAIERRLKEKGYGENLYATRWERNKWLFERNTDTASVEPADDEEGGRAVESGPDPVWDGPAGGTTDDAVKRLDDARRNLKREVAAAEGRDPDLAEDFEAIVAGFDEEATNLADPHQWPGAEGDEAATPDDGLEAERAQVAEAEPRDWVWGALVAAGDRGLAPREIMTGLARAGHATHRTTVHEWLKRWTDEGRLKKSLGRYYVTAAGQPEDGSA